MTIHDDMREVERLREDAERYRWLRDHALWSQAHEFPEPLQSLLQFTEHCISASDEGVDFHVPRAWLDAMTTLGLLEKAGRARWSVTDKADAFVSALKASPVQAEAVAFVNHGDSEATFVADAESLNCPACGGSGHVDDVQASADDVEAQARELSPDEVDVGAWPEPPQAGMHVGMPHGVCVTHKNTGLTVCCTHERSQHKNRDTALRAITAALRTRSGGESNG